MSRSAILGLGVLLFFGVMLFFSMRGVRQVSCELCIEFGGETVCRTGEGRSQEEAQRSAAESCCAVLPTSGMAERIKCAQSEPTRMSCD